MSSARRSLATLVVVFCAAAAAQDPGASTAKPAAAKRPALTVQVVRPQSIDLLLRVSASGTVAAWQEAILGAEINGLRLTEISADVGDSVKQGQVLARFASETVEADIEQAKAALAEAEAAAAEAAANAARAREVQSSGALSALQIAQYLTAEKTSQARVASLRAALGAQQLRLRHTRVLASDDGIVSSRSATLGAVPAQGQELFRLIRKGRLEWRAEVTAADLARIRAGQQVTVVAPGGAKTEGRVRRLGPTVDAQTRNALVYVDLPGAAHAAIRPGMFVSGEFLIGRKTALTVPQTALALREGFSYVFSVGRDGRVTQVKVELGRREGDRYEVVSGLKGGETLVAGGAAFLSDGDTVRVVAPEPAKK
jgi:RND family efflux transporter MFP subunit